MPEAHTSDQKLAPKSVLRHRPIEDQCDPRGATSFVPVAQRASRPPSRVANANAPASKRTATTETAQQRPLPHRTLSRPLSSSIFEKTKRASQLAHPQRATVKTAVQLHPLLLLGLGMLSMLMLWTLLSAVAGWVRITLDDVQYGRPRTYQTDAWVGHHEQTGLPSHFIVLNLHQRIDIIEIQGGDPAHTRIYPGPQLSGTQDALTPATIRFVTPRGKKVPNMILVIGSSQLTYLNTGQTFVPQ